MNTPRPVSGVALAGMAISFSPTPNHLVMADSICPPDNSNLLCALDEILDAGHATRCEIAGLLNRPTFTTPIG
jgi:hypothetical protein